MLVPDKECSLDELGEYSWQNSGLVFMYFEQVFMPYKRIEYTKDVTLTTAKGGR